MLMMGGDRKKLVASILGPDGKEVKEAPSDEGASELEAIAQELCEAVANSDAAQVVAAFKAMFAACEAAPHYEGPHKEE